MDTKMLAPLPLPPRQTHPPLTPITSMLDILWPSHKARCLLCHIYKGQGIQLSSHQVHSTQEPRGSCAGQTQRQRSMRTGAMEGRFGPLRLEEQDLKPKEWRTELAICGPMTRAGYLAKW